jgi:hypothetical protein
MFVDVDHGIPPQPPIYGLPICKGKCENKEDECRRIPYDSTTRTVAIRCECSVPHPHIHVRPSES